ncbi:DUF7126 family protein [Natronolimnobius baerhuensis]|uniref:CTP synthetase n=1 Tax=Natronolimnobius baerhuensis TaxID=253108 RepID=A0A202E9C4_9EURY|nr:hypothetical protein [Natronolimnobius baerhuensis]OVE84852.1 CTP synthetase [Natronolimnobius baerhuensis]
MAVTNAVVAGADDNGITDALEAEGVEVARLEGVISRPQLEEAGIVEAQLYVLTDVSQATTIPIVCDLSDDIRTVVYSRESSPEFVKAQLDFAVDPKLLDPALVAEELLG